MMIRSRYAIPLICGLLAAVVVAAYWPLRLNGFVRIDDALYITGNCDLQKGLTTESLAWAFRFNNISYWHPLTWVSLLIDYQIFGLNPAGYHLLNLFFHYCNAVLLFRIMHRMTGFLWRSLFLSLLFALHPMNVEAVAWAVERKTVLSSFFWMLSIGAYLFHIRKPSIPRYLLLCLTFALGLMSKTSVVTLPCILLLLDYWPLGRHLASPVSAVTPFRRVGRLFLEKVPLFLLSLLSTVISIAAVGGKGGAAEAVGTPLPEKLANAVVSYAAYLIKMLWPTDLAVFYPLRHVYPLWQIAGAALLLLGVSAFSFVKRKELPWLMVGWFWYILSMLPAIGLVRGGLWPEMADRFGYIPFIGLYLLLAWGGSEVIRHRSRPILLALSATASLLFYGTLTFVQTGYWRNSITLFEHARKVSGETAESYRGIGGDLFDAGDYAKALDLFAKVRELEPESIDLDLAEALMARKRNDLPRAAELAELALQKNEDDLSILFLLGEIAQSRGEGRNAIRYYNQVLHSPQQDVEKCRCRAEENLKRLAATQLPQLDVMRRAVAMNPSSAPARLDLAAQLDDLGFYEEALQHYLYLESAGLGNGNLFFSLGRLYTKLQQGQRAAAYFEKTMQVDPANVAALNETGLFYLERKRYQEAVSCFEKASAINPRYPFAPFNLGMAHLKMGDKPAALRYLRLVEERFPEFRVRVAPFVAELQRQDLKSIK